MTILIEGNAEEYILYTANSIPVSSPTGYWVAFQFRLVEQVTNEGASELVRFGPTGSGASLSYAPVGSSTVNIRTSTRIIINDVSENERSPNVPLTEGEWTTVVLFVDYEEGVMEHYINGSLVHSRTKDLEEDVWRWHSHASDAVIPKITGAQVFGKNFEISDFVASLDGVITSQEAANFNFSDDLSLLSTPPSWGIKPVGPGTSHAFILPDIYGENNMTQSGGPVPPADGFPVYVGPPADISVTATTTARTVSIEGSTSDSGGTVYIVVDTASNMPTPPSAADISGGFLGDGVTPAAFSDSTAMTTTALSFSFGGVPANTLMAYAVVHDKDDEGDYSEVTYGTLITKKPVVGPGDFIWRDVNSQPLTNETGMTFTVLGTGYSGSGVSTNAEAKGSVDLTGYVNSGAEVDIGDTVSVTVLRSNGEELIARNVTVFEG